MKNQPATATGRALTSSRCLGGLLSLLLLTTECTSQTPATQVATSQPAATTSAPTSEATASLLSLQKLSEVSATTKAAQHKTLSIAYITKKGKVETRPIKLYIPAGAAAKTPLIYVPHYEIAENSTELTSYLKEGWAVASPTEFKDAYNGVLVSDDLVFNNAALYTLRNLAGIDKNRIGVVGGSAGGYTTLMLDALQMGTAVSVAAAPISNVYFNFNKYFGEVQRITKEKSSPTDQQEFLKLFVNPETMLQAFAKLPLGIASVTAPIFDNKAELPAEADTARWEALSPAAIARTFSSPLVIHQNTSDMLVPLGQNTRQHVYANMGKTLPSGFTTHLGKGYPGVLSRTLEEQLDPKTTKVSYTADIRSKTGELSLPFDRAALVNIDVYDDGPPEKTSSHGAPDIKVSLSNISYLKLQLTRGLAQAEVLSPEKILLLLDRYAGTSLQLPAHQGVADTVYGSLAVYRQEVVQHLSTWGKTHSYQTLETRVTAAIKTQEAKKRPGRQATWAELRKELK